MAQKYVMINDIIKEHNARMYNLRKYYPFFVLSETTFAQYKEGRYAGLDMGYITMGVLRFLIQENSMNEREVTYDEYEEFMGQLLDRDFDVEIKTEDRKELIAYIFDKIRNDGKAFEFNFYDPSIKKSKVGRVKLVDGHIRDGQVRYFITAEGIEFYLDTKEIKEESKINVEQLLLEKMITGENFKGGIEVVKRINNEVNRLVREKDEIVDMFGYDVFKAAERYEKYMKTVGNWFMEEQKMFARNKALVDKAVARAGYDKAYGSGNKTFKEISELELLLKKTILKHGSLINSTMELQEISDNIIHRAKLKKLKASFDFQARLMDIIREDRPDKMFTVLSPLFAPKNEKWFSFASIDNILTLKSDDNARMVKVKQEETDSSFRYEDELLDDRISRNFGRLFFELADQLIKWDRLTLKEFNGILEIRFGKEIYGNKDYYSFLTHLVQKKHYDIDDMLKKQETMLEGVVVEALTGKTPGMGSETDGEYAPKLSMERFKGLKFDIECDPAQEIAIGEDMYVTNMIFVRKGDSKHGK